MVKDKIGVMLFNIESWEITPPPRTEGWPFIYSCIGGSRIGCTGGRPATICLMPSNTTELQIFDEMCILVKTGIWTAYLKPHAYPHFHHTTQSLMTIWGMLYAFVLTLKSICSSGWLHHPPLEIHFQRRVMPPPTP